jgi:hypothetical protein
MTKRTGNLGAVLALASVSALGFLACSTAQVAPAPNVDVHLPIAERRVFVELPGNTTLSADALRTRYDEGRRTISHVRQRCVAGTTTAFCTQTTDVRITAVEGAKYVDPLHAPRHPQIIAWIENIGNRETYDGIEPMTSAVYALVVDSLPVENPGIVRVRFPAPRAAVRGNALGARDGRVYACHYYGQPYISDADFQPCSPYPLLGMGALHSLNTHAVFASTSNAVALTASDPTWFSCSSGCCSGTAHQTY